MTMLPGIDVSQWNAIYNPAGLAFVFIRACYGTGKDPKYDQHLATAKAARLVTGAYCFGRDMDPIYQADRLLEIGSDADLLVLDWETDEGHGKMTSAQARAFISHVRKANRTVGLYASESGYPADGFGANWRWIANYSRKPSIPWTFWQYSGTGIDRDWYAGTMAELLTLAGRVVQVPLPQPGGAPVKFVQLNAADVAKLPSIAVPANTPIEDFAGEQWDTIGPTNVHVLPGLVDAHTNRRMVVVSTSRFYSDNVDRPTAQVAVLTT